MRLRNTLWGGILGACLTINASPCGAVTYPVKNSTELLVALYEAANNGTNDTIKIAQGEYRGAFVYSSPNGYSLTIEGGWSSDFATRFILAANTVLDGGGSQRVLGIVGNAASVTVEGITLTHGSWNVSGTGGGGLFINTPGGDVTVRRCDITQNLSGNSGGGGLLVISGGGNVDLTGNIILENQAPNSGGGAYIQAGAGDVTLSENVIADNTSSSLGGGVRLSATGNIQIENNQVIGNIATGGGSGGMYLVGPSSLTDGAVTVTGNTFHGNSSWVQYSGTLYIQARDVTIDGNSFSNNLLGYGLYLHAAPYLDWTVQNNIVMDNAQGGGIRLDGYSNLDSVRVINNVVSGNSYSRSDGLGGGIDFKWARGRALFMNNTITNNTTVGVGGGLRILTDKDDTVIRLHSNIITSNSATIDAANVYIDNDGNNNLIYAPLTILNNDFDQAAGSFFVKDSTFPTRIDASNLDGVDPLFLDVAANDLRLQSASPCINSGDSAAPEIPLLDVAGEPRIMGGGIDMGAYEAAGAVLPVALFSASPLSGEAPLTVDFQDLSLGTVASRAWDFGDGSGSDEQHPVHTYTAAGSYTVTLTVNGPEGTDSESKNAFITVALHPPLAAAGPDRCIAQQSVLLSGAASSDPDGSVVSYQWHLAHRTDPTSNQSVTGMTPTILDLQSGFYDVTLTVTDDDGLTGSDTMVLAVSDPGDIGGDGQAGLAEAVHILRVLSGL